MKTFTKEEIIQEVADYLREWGDGKLDSIEKWNQGICYELAALEKKLGLTSEADLTDILSLGVLSWPYYDGHSLGYPVSDHLGECDNNIYFYDAFSNLWTQRHGLRFNLCHHLAEWLEENMEDFL